MLESYALILCRIGGLVLAAPVLGSRVVPFRFRLALVVVLSLVVAPIAGVQTPESDHELIEWMFLEAMVGTLMGLGLRILVAGFAMSGHVIGQMTGIKLDGSTPQQDEEVGSVMGRLYNWIAIIGFIVIGGPSRLVRQLLNSYIDIPIGSFAFDFHAGNQLLLDITQTSFQLAIQVGMPVFVCLFCATIVVGLISRSVPQVNMMNFGLIANSMILVVSISLSMGAAMWMFQNHCSDLIDSKDWRSVINLNVPN
ncbi:flagellar biosynthetic protein FliR [Vicingaceae bacterium]|nr:flagellar biosynthetic protein FliR [Vicingaceae bacterium]